MNLERYTELAFFQGLCVDDIRVMSPYFAPEHWVAGTTVFQQGDAADYLYLVVQGEVTIHYKPDDGPMMILTRVLPGGVFGWSAAIRNPTYTSGAVCALDTEVLRIRGEDLRRLCDENPHIGKIVLERLSSIIAERKRSQHTRVTSILENGMRKQSRGKEPQP